MSTIQAKNRWDTSKYLRMTGVRYDMGQLVVDFADGTVVRVEAGQLPWVLARRPDWPTLRANEYEVIVPTAEGDFELTSFSIRLLTDSAFEAHVTAKEKESAQWIGQRVHELRRGRELTIDTLAKRAGVPASLVADIERGDHDGDLGELQRLVEAMGHEMNDLIRPEAEVETVAMRTA